MTIVLSTKVMPVLWSVDLVLGDDVVDRGRR